MKYYVVLGMAILSAAFFAYLNHYQNELMTQPPRSQSIPSQERDPKLRELAETLSAIETVYVPITEESHEAVYNAALENPGKTIFELGVAAEDLPNEIEVLSPDGATQQRVSALIVFTSDHYLKPDVPFRTDTPRFVLEHVMRHPQFDYLVLNPRNEISQNVPEPIVLSAEDISTLYQYLN